MAPLNHERFDRQGVIADRLRAWFPAAELLWFFPVLYEGWELDTVGCVARLDGRLVALGTDHGLPVVLDPSVLSDRAEAYVEALRLTRQALTETSLDRSPW